MSSPSAQAPHKLVRVYTEAIEALRGSDLERRCEAAGYAWDPKSIPMPLLGRQYSFSVTDFELLPERQDADTAGTSVGTADPDSLSERILVLHYLARAAGTPLSGRLVGFDQLPGGRFYGGAFRKRAEAPLAGLFSRQTESLVETAEKLGGTRGTFGDVSVVISPFPRVPMTLIVWTGDDEMPANGKVLFDDTAEGYLSTEDLAVLGEVVFRRLKQIHQER